MVLDAGHNVQGRASKGGRKYRVCMPNVECEKKREARAILGLLKRAGMSGNFLLNKQDPAQCRFPPPSQNPLFCATPLSSREFLPRVHTILTRQNGERYSKLVTRVGMNDAQHAQENPPSRGNFAMRIPPSMPLSVLTQLKHSIMFCPMGGWMTFIYFLAAMGSPLSTLWFPST
jgi:hypothetical protein